MFNKNILECIPNSVTRLIFADDFNQNIEGCIPDSVQQLIINHRIISREQQATYLNVY